METIGEDPSSGANDRLPYRSESAAHDDEIRIEDGCEVGKALSQRSTDLCHKGSRCFVSAIGCKNNGFAAQSNTIEGSGEGTVRVRVDDLSSEARERRA